MSFSNDISQINTIFIDTSPIIYYISEAFFFSEDIGEKY